MKLLFIITNQWVAYMDYEYTGTMPQLKKRAVEIELTDEQIKQIGLQKIGFDLGEPVMEAIESVNIMLNKPQEDKPC